MIECSMYGNENLENVSSLQTCTALDILYLESNENMRVDDIILIEPILLGCTAYTIPSKYLKYFSSVTMYDYTNSGLTDYSEEILALKDRTNVTYLRLYGNTNLGKSRIGKQIKEGNLKYASRNAIIVDDVLYTGNTINRGIKILKDVGIDTAGVSCIATLGKRVAETLEDKNIEVVNLTNYKNILKEALDNNIVDKKEYENLKKIYEGK